MFVVDEIHVVDVVDVLRVVDGEDFERFLEGLVEVPMRIRMLFRKGYTNEWKDCCLFISLNRFWLCTYARVKLILIGMAWSYGTFRLINQFLLQSSHRAISRSNEFETG